MIKRYLTEQIVVDLKEKIVLVSGPRQVGKTTLYSKNPKRKTGRIFSFLSLPIVWLNK